MGSRDILLRGVLGLQVIVLLATIPSHRLDGDEAWLAVQSYTMSQQGYSTSPLFGSLTREDVRVVVQHKLFIYLGAALCRSVGFGLFTFRLISIASCLLLFMVLFRYVRRYYGRGTSTELAAAAVLLLVPGFFYFAKIARPEMLVTLLGFSSFVLLEGHLRSGARRSLALSGCAAGLAMLAHLSGSIFIATGAAVLLLNRRHAGVPVFVLCAAAAFTPYVYDVARHYDLFVLQISGPLVASRTSLTLFAPLANMAREHERLLHNPQTIASSVLFLFLVFSTWRSLRADNPILVSYTLVLMIALGMIVADKTVKHMTLLVPFWAVLIARGLRAFDGRRGPLGTVVLALAFVLFTGVGVLSYWQGLQGKADYAQMNRKIAAFIPAGATCLAPMNFVFDELPRYTILSTYFARYELDGVITIDRVARFCERNGCGYVVFNRFGERIDDLRDYDNRTLLTRHFDVIVETPDFTVLKRRAPAEP
jgi:hypothetical protein